ncbi:MAG: hypothetical protein OEY49_19250, partial [Candidatus Heimdallarchaeota archaeon]|nr:hypothetical protein [Candidatus Heimdallarchaeota archaeon]
TFLSMILFELINNKEFWEGSIIGNLITIVFYVSIPIFSKSIKLIRYQNNQEIILKYVENKLFRKIEVEYRLDVNCELLYFPHSISRNMISYIKNSSNFYIPNKNNIHQQMVIHWPQGQIEKIKVGHNLDWGMNHLTKILPLFNGTRVSIPQLSKSSRRFYLPKFEFCIISLSYNDNVEFKNKFEKFQENINSPLFVKKLPQNPLKIIILNIFIVCLIISLIATPFLLSLNKTVMMYLSLLHLNNLTAEPLNFEMLILTGLTLSITISAILIGIIIFVNSIYMLHYGIVILFGKLSIHLTTDVLSIQYHFCKFGTANINIPINMRPNFIFNQNQLSIQLFDDRNIKYYDHPIGYIKEEN